VLCVLRGSRQASKQGFRVLVSLDVSFAEQKIILFFMCSHSGRQSRQVKQQQQHEGARKLQQIVYLFFHSRQAKAAS